MAIDVLEKQVSENAGASFFFFFFLFFFFHVSVPKGSSESQAFLSKTAVETGKKNHDDFHCMQMSLVMSMQFIFGDDENDALS